MGVSLSRNTITVAKDGDVWRATLGSDPNTGVSSAAADPFTAIELTLGKAREKGWAFDGFEDLDEAPAEKGDAPVQPAEPTEKPLPPTLVKPAPAPTAVPASAK